MVSSVFLVVSFGLKVIVVMWLFVFVFFCLRMCFSMNSMVVLDMFLYFWSVFCVGCSCVLFSVICFCMWLRMLCLLGWMV